jgi:hypothetical protein
MSFNTHARDAMDLALPNHQRCSHLRSCALKLAQLRNAPRSTVVTRIAESIGIDVLRNDLEDAEIEAALRFITLNRDEELESAILAQNQAQQAGGGKRE